MTKRIEFIDALKGFAIFCVLWGHALQYLRGNYDFFHNPLFEFIYSFHMPLFFVVSGFFFASSLKLNIKDFMLKKGKQLLLPCFSWAILFALLYVATTIYHNTKIDYVRLLKSVSPLGWFWFLRELFISYCIVYFALKMLKKQWLACLLSICFVLIAPFCGTTQRFLLPMFWVGIFLKDNYHFLEKYSKWILPVTTVLFALCLVFWNGNYTMYVSPLKILNLRELTFNTTNIDIALFRLAIGIVGSVFWFMLFLKIYKNNRIFLLLSQAGTYTMGIYILQRKILEIWINKILDFPNVNIWVYNFLITPLIAVLVGFGCIFLIKFISKSKFLGTVLFGK
ncbi:MAG: acyltransferase family protein [Dysgonamonadaceae bacterium]|jgi:fucose 4-O-acetylase-like acetyltransferase|nr:acyltransferase family protein [Dysgonamonadaceae bacterium]